MITSTTVLRWLFGIEDYIVKNADFISTISAGMIEKVKAKRDTEIVYFPNWVDTSVFYPVVDRNSLKQRFGFKATDKIILYSGAMGEKQGLQSIIHAAKNFEQHSGVKFVICGSGPYKTHLVKLKEDLGLQNVVFLPLQPVALFNDFLNIADAHLVLQKANASDLVMPSKLSTILSIGGVAIVTASRGTSLYNIMTSCDMGILIEPEDGEALLQAIQCVLSCDLTAKSRRARTYAEDNLAIERILPRYAAAVLGLRQPKKQQ